MTILIVGLMVAIGGISVRPGLPRCATPDEDLARRQALLDQRSRRARRLASASDEDALWARERERYAKRETELRSD
jgi:hypothetical protein